MLNESPVDSPGYTLISDHFTGGEDPFDMVGWKRVDLGIHDASGEAVWSMNGVEVPESWSEHSALILASKYFRRAGVPQRVEDFSYIEDDLPSSVYESGDGILKYESGAPVLGSERSMKQVAHRLALFWSNRANQSGLVDKDQADSLYRETVYMLLRQVAAPNSPQFFNAGLYDAYGIRGNPTGLHYRVDAEYDSENAIRLEDNSYVYPQLSACFIQPIEDSLCGEGGITDLLRKEAAVFKYGSGSGTNFSNLRGEGEKLSVGGESSGLMSWLSIYDRAAGAIKSGGATRRAARMVVVNLDHPDVEDFVSFKTREEVKVAALIRGAEAIRQGAEDPHYTRHALKRLDLELDTDFNGEAYRSVDGQNANNSVRIPDLFMHSLTADGGKDAGGGLKHFAWQLHNRVDGSVANEVDGAGLWWGLCWNAWKSADPGVQFDDVINRWHTVPNDGRINASNPCAEYLHLDDTSCNLASLNMLKFLDEDSVFAIEDYTHAIRVWTLILETTVYAASFPSKGLAEGTFRTRPLGLGYSNIGALVMALGLSYESEPARETVAALSSILSAKAYETSALIAADIGPFEAFERNRSEMLRVIDQHRVAAEKRKAAENPEEYIAFENAAEVNSYATTLWSAARLYGEVHGYRNAQVTAIAPTGTISFLMGCDTTGIEPAFSPISFKTLVGGGKITIFNHAIRRGLHTLGYTRDEIDAAEQAIREGKGLEDTPIQPKDYGVFTCAVPTPGSDRAILPESHVLMLGRAQPFISGGISKSINLPRDSTVEDVSDVYLLAWKQGVKCLSLYRDGSKLSQPLSATDGSEQQEHEPAKEPDSKPVAAPGSTSNDSPRAIRRKLPETCNAVRHKFTINQFEGYIKVGIYDDGTPGEVFISATKSGSALSGLLNAYAISMSMLLQYGVPLEKIVNKFEGQTFEPHGMTMNREIPFAKSPVDYVARWMRLRFIGSGSRPSGGKGAAESSDGPEPTGLTHGKACEVCGSAMVRAGTCWSCPGCGGSSGGCD